MTEREIMILRGEAERGYVEAKQRGDQTLMATERERAIRYDAILRHLRQPFDHAPTFREYWQ